MPKIRALFWDIGGVLLTNAWDHHERDLAVEHFQLVKAEFETRHKEMLVPLEEGRLTLDQYLERAVFHSARSFKAEEFKQFIFALSRPRPEVLEMARKLSASLCMCTINNESRELNQYRIHTFGLAEIFDVFVSSCFVGVRKPDARIYRMALDLTQYNPAESCFIDDRPVNIEAAAKLGMSTVLMQNPAQLKKDLQGLEIEI